MNSPAGARLRIPEATIEVLASIGEHRVLSTAQVRAIHFPDRSPRRTQQVLNLLRQAELVAHAESPRAPRRVWFLTERGADWVDASSEVDRRPKVLSPEQAAGPLCAHTLGVNDVGISFLRAARERDDEFLPLSWRHEVAHSLNRGRGRASQKLIADAVFTYLRGDDREIVIEQRFIEVDRATLSLERMVAELARYGQLERARDKSGERLWRYFYPAFPPVICALTGASRKSLAARRDGAIAMLARHPSLTSAYNVRIDFCLLDDLTDRGPFAPIFQTVEGDGAVDWIGEQLDDH